MPDRNGVLSSFEVSLVINRLKQLDEARGETMRCSVCEHQSWAIEPYVVGMQPVGNFGASISPYPSKQLVAVSCNNCSHTVLFSAVYMGVQQAAPQEAARNALANLPLPPPRTVGKPNG